jgi:hypothetical protein
VYIFSLDQKPEALGASMTRKFAFVWIAGALFFAVPVALSQQGENFRTRLSPVPIDVSMQPRVAGAGSVTAALQGARLTVSGTFEGMRSAATAAHLHRGPRGIPGPRIFDLTVTKAPSGSVSGSVDLTLAQVEDLRNGRIYVQIHSESAPEGNLRGWLLP